MEHLTYNHFTMERWIWTGLREYWVSDRGRVARKIGDVMRLRRPTKNSRGYLILDINIGGTRKGRKSRTVHSLVLEAFAGPRPTPSHQGNHKDGDRTNNRVENLEWVTPSENQIHGLSVLGNKRARGEAHGNARLTEERVHEIRALLAAGVRKMDVARWGGISPKTIRDIEHGESWGWLGEMAPAIEMGELIASVPIYKRPTKEKRPKPPTKAERAEAELLAAMHAGVKVVFTPYIGAIGNYYTRQDTGERCTGVARRLFHSGRAKREGAMLVPAESEGNAT